MRSSATLLFRISAIAEIFTGLALLLAPALVVTLLLGGQLDQTGVAVARILGITLISLGVAGWESPRKTGHPAPRVGLCLYNLGVAVMLLALGTHGGMRGMLLWPVAVLHGVLGAMMLWIILGTKSGTKD